MWDHDVRVAAGRVASDAAASSAGSEFKSGTLTVVSSAQVMPCAGLLARRALIYRSATRANRLLQCTGGRSALRRPDSTTTPAGQPHTGSGPGRLASSRSERAVTCAAPRAVSSVAGASG